MLWDMKKYHGYALLIFILTCISSFRPAYGAGLPPDIQQILNHGTLIVAIYQKDTPPFFMQDKTGKLIGYDVDLARELAHRLGVKLTFNRQATTFDELINLVAKGQ